MIASADTKLPKLIISNVYCDLVFCQNKKNNLYFNLANCIKKVHFNTTYKVEARDNIQTERLLIHNSGFDLAARYSQKCAWVFQIFPLLRVIKSITRKFLRVDLILIKLIYNVKVLKSAKLKLTQVFLHIFSRQIA